MLPDLQLIQQKLADMQTLLRMIEQLRDDIDALCGPRPSDAEITATLDRLAIL